MDLLDRVLEPITGRSWIRRVLIPATRGYVRYAPWTAGKHALWTRVINAYLAWNSYEFVASTRFGVRLGGNTRDVLQQYIYYFGIWEPQLTRWISRTLSAGDTFVDIGANIGYFSLLASRLVGEAGRVVAIDASPSTFQALQENLRINQVRNVRALNMAVSDQRGTVDIFKGPETNTGLSTTLQEEAARRGCEWESRMEAAPLAEILQGDELHSARLVKIDVEGAEWSVISGMLPLLSAGRRDLEVIVEISPGCLAQQRREPAQILQVFSEAGFHAYEVENDYHPKSYLSSFAEKKPARLRHAIESETDVVFSRRDTETL